MSKTTDLTEYKISKLEGVDRLAYDLSADIANKIDDAARQYQEKFQEIREKHSFDLSLPTETLQEKILAISNDYQNLCSELFKKWAEAEQKLFLIDGGFE